VGRVTVVAIQRGDLDRVGRFLHENLNGRISSEGWADAAIPPWRVDSPNHGFALVDDGRIVGAYLAFYSNRMIDAREERFCNLAAWCVLPTHRLYSLQLLKALLSQQNYHFTDLSPSGNTIAINERLRFKLLETSAALMLNFPVPTWRGQFRLISDADPIASVLEGPTLRIYRDHQHARGARHVVITSGSEHCYVMFRRDRRKNLSLFASVLHVSHPPLFLKAARTFGRHLLFRYGIPFTLLESRIVGTLPTGVVRLRRIRPKMFRSDKLRANQIDYLYSELTCVPW